MSQTRTLDARVFELTPHQRLEKIAQIIERSQEGRGRLLTDAEVMAIYLLASSRYRP